jgi:hypothetical protein
MQNLLPMDVIKNIIEYVSDIDVRRAFNIYGRIDMSMNSLPIGCLNIHITEPTKYCCSIPNMYDFTERKVKNILDDFIEVRLVVENDDSPILYYLSVYRFKPKSLKQDPYAFELFPSRITKFYWDYRVYSYTRQ